MKRMLLAVMLFSITACAPNKPAQTIAPADTVSKKTTVGVQYTCTMHPGVLSDKPGTCPKCGMDLVEKNK